MLLRAGRPVTLRTGWRLAVRWVPNPRTTPFTFGYLVLLLGTTLLLTFADRGLTSRLLELSSTDAHNLWRRPLTSLVTSALWIGDDSWPVCVLIFAIAVAPLERRFGARRTAIVFFSGHLLATLATELPVMALIGMHVLDRSAGHWLDIGVSYGFFTTAGALVFLLRGRARIAALVLLEAFIALIYLSDDPASLDDIVTLLGHACAAHFGFFFWGRRLPASPSALKVPFTSSDARILPIGAHRHDRSNAA